MTYPPPPSSPEDPKPSLSKEGSTPGGDPYQQPYPGNQYPSSPQYENPQYENPQYENPQYDGPQYGNQQYGAPPSGQPDYGSQPYGSGQYGAPAYGGGFGQPQYSGIPAVAQTNGKAIGALVCGIAGLILCIIAAIPAIIFGNMAVAEIDASNGTQDGRSMAVAGRILGWVGLGLLIIGLVVVLIVIIAAAASTS